MGIHILRRALVFSHWCNKQNIVILSHGLSESMPPAACFFSFKVTQSHRARDPAKGMSRFQFEELFAHSLEEAVLAFDNTTWSANCLEHHSALRRCCKCNITVLLPELRNSLNFLQEMHQANASWHDAIWGAGSSTVSPRPLLYLEPRTFLVNKTGKLPNGETKAQC